ncbi:MAG: hypothetical protein WKF76_10095 [Nocardioidaceae bacterium]
MEPLAGGADERRVLAHPGVSTGKVPVRGPAVVYPCALARPHRRRDAYAVVVAPTGKDVTHPVVLGRVGDRLEHELAVVPGLTLSADEPTQALRVGTERRDDAGGRRRHGRGRVRACGCQ